MAAISPEREAQLKVIAQLIIEHREGRIPPEHEANDLVCEVKEVFPGLLEELAQAYIKNKRNGRKPNT